ncbi:MAG: hypothetical protein WBJ52_02070 [Methanoregulaceae archaeon]|nr:hypothetical protein [Methanoregulaceae archaeon]HRU30697.1 hypothetical protein [Methanoregulaceae archaeon]
MPCGTGNLPAPCSHRAAFMLAMNYPERGARGETFLLSMKETGRD